MVRNYTASQWVFNIIFSKMVFVQVTAIWFACWKPNRLKNMWDRKRRRRKNYNRSWANVNDKSKNAGSVVVLVAESQIYIHHAMENKFNLWVDKWACVKWTIKNIERQRELRGIQYRHVQPKFPFTSYDFWEKNIFIHANVLPSVGFGINCVGWCYKKLTFR